MDKVSSRKLAFVLEIVFVVFLVVFVSFTALSMAISWEVFKSVLPSGRLLAATYLASSGVVFFAAVLYVARRLDDWAKS
jgi:hypothetical protein